MEFFHNTMSDVIKQALSFSIWWDQSLMTWFLTQLWERHVVKIEFISGYKASQPQSSEENGGSFGEEETCLNPDIWKELCLTLTGANCAP